MYQSRPRRDLIALIRIQPKADWRVYMSCILDVCMYLITALVCVLTIISFALLSYAYPRLVSRFSLSYIAGWLVLLGVTGFVFVEAKKSIKVLRGLWLLFHAPASRAAKFSWSQYLRFSLPPWLHAEEVLHDPSPSSILDRVQGPILTTKELSQMSQELVEYVQEEIYPSLSMLASISNQVTISVIGQDGRQEAVVLTNPHWAGIVALLAMRGKGAWVPRDELIRLVYGKVTSDTRALFNVDKGRINKQINEAVEAAELFQGSSTDSSPEKIDLFESVVIEKIPCWRLSPVCEIDVCNALMTLHQTVRDAQEGKEGATTLSREELRAACHHLMETIGRGLLADYQEADAEDDTPDFVWPWAEEQYITSRDQCLEVLEYAAKQEVTYAERECSPQERREVLKSAARYFRWMVFIAIGTIPEETKAEKALCECLKLYKLLMNRSSARSLFQKYVQRMRESDAQWQASSKVTDIWPEAVVQERVNQ